LSGASGKPANGLPGGPAPSASKRGIVSRRLSVPHPRPTGAVDPLFGEPLLAQLRRDLTEGEYSTVAHALDCVTDPDDRFLLIETIADWNGRPDWIDNWLKAHPRLPAANLIAGAHAVFWGWQARGDFPSGAVPPEAVEAMTKRLQFADTLLHRAAELDPMDPTPWAFLVRSARGLELDECETRQRFEHVTRLAPHHRAAHTHMLQRLCAKWGGTHEFMFSFAQHASRSAPPGAGVHVMIAEAHFERWLADLKGAPRSPDPYFQNPKVRDALKLAATLAFDSGNGDSGDSDQFEPTIDSIRNRNFFAFCFHLAGLRDEAASQFRNIGGWATSYPWVIFGDPLKTFSRAAAASGIMLAKAA
jgi:hypothetical protein